MRVIIQVTERDYARAWGSLARHGAGTALSNHTFISSEQAAVALRDAGVKLKELAREKGEPTSGEALSGERI